MGLPCHKGKGCAYKKPVPGSSHHLTCQFDWAKSGTPVPQNTGRNYSKRWFLFPYNYDIIWGDDCENFSEEKDPNLIRETTALDDLLGIFGLRM